MSSDEIALSRVSSIPSVPSVGAETIREERDDNTDGLPTTALGQITVVRSNSNGAHRLQKRQDPRLLNNILLGIGFLEIANAGDFAANVWNQDPPPLFAQVLMGLGGALALFMIYFAARDGILSWRNIQGLRAERRLLYALMAQHGHDRQHVQTLNALLDCNKRELGCEFINRFGMDCLMGFGALVVGVGTLLAIGGADQAIFQGSNQLTGYVGNSPCALYGLLNLMWSIYLSIRAVQHNRAVVADLGEGNVRIERMLRNRTSSVRFHAALNGIAAAVAGAASLATATMWWGYVVLLPCLATSVLVNIFWRHRVGYGRSFVRELPSMDERTVLDTLRYLDWCIQRVKDHTNEPLAALVSDRSSLPIVMEFVTDNQLFETFCLRIMQDADLTRRVFPGTQDMWTVTWRDLAEITDAATAAQLLDIADKLVREAAPTCFKHQQRYLLEVLGSYACAKGKKGKTPRHHQPTTTRGRNAHTYSGRHGDDWLFGGFKMTELVKQAFRT